LANGDINAFFLRHTGDGNDNGSIRRNPHFRTHIGDILFGIPCCVEVRKALTVWYIHNRTVYTAFAKHCFCAFSWDCNRCCTVAEEADVF
jgi:hypothetical protein